MTVEGGDHGRPFHFSKTTYVLIKRKKLVTPSVLEPMNIPIFFSDLKKRMAISLDHLEHLKAVHGPPAPGLLKSLLKCYTQAM